MRYALLMAGALLLTPGTLLLAGGGEADVPSGRGDGQARAMRRQWQSQDLHLAARDLVSHQVDTGSHLLVFEHGFSMVLAGRQWGSDSAVVWIKTKGSPDDALMQYDVQVYLKGHVSPGRAADTQELRAKEVVIERGQAVVVKASFRGQVFVTAESRETGSPYDLPLYQGAVAAFGKAGWEEPPATETPAPSATVTPGREKEASSRAPINYTVSIGWQGDVAPAFEMSKTEGAEIITMIGRVYVWWQEQAEGTNQPRLVELQADTLVLWRRTTGKTDQSAGVSPMQQEGVSEIYVAGDVLLTEGQRTVHAKELYYDLQNKRGLVRNAVMRSFDASRNIPVYVRAGELRQLSDTRFEADDASVTTSEFWKPQLSVEASKVRVMDRIKEVEPNETVPENSYTAEMKGVRFKYYDMTLLKLPSFRTNLLSPAAPLKGIHAGHDSSFGASVETQWFLGRLLGLREPEGTDSTLFLDYYDKRGPGGGVGVDYQRENYFGRILGYAIEDHGKDRLGRERKNIDVPEDTRGRFEFQHRQYLPYDWQLTAEASYMSDKNFLEQYYRREFNVGKEQETLLHLKHIQDNRALAFLGKVRINDFLSQVEELPSAEYHWTGQSFLDDRFVFFSDSQASRLRYRLSSEVPAPPGNMPEDTFTFLQTRNEVDMPLQAGSSKVVPFVASTFGYDGGTGFRETLDEGPAEHRDEIWIGEAGVRMSTQPFWRVYPDVESRLWDLHQLRHTIRPSLTAVAYTQSDAVAEQRDTLDLGIAQRWQTKRGPEGRQRTVDWLAMDMDFVWVGEPGEETAGPDQYIWNDPFIPLINRLGSQVPPLDRRTSTIFGPRRNYAGTAMTWRASETTSVLGDIYLDMQSGDVKQLDVGFSRLVWPNLSYFIGSRYLRDVDNGLGQHGSNAVTFAVTYVLDPRYTLVFSEQYDFDYGAGIRSDITLIRKYHRLNFAVTLSVDESLDEERFVLSLWPEGVPELGVGLRRYIGLGASETIY